MEFIKKHNIFIFCFFLILCLSSLAFYNYISQKRVLLHQLSIDTENVHKSVSSSINKFSAIKDTLGIQHLLKSISLELDIFEFRYMNKDGVILNSMFAKEIGGKFQRPDFDPLDPKNLGRFYQDIRDMTNVLAIFHPVKRGKELIGIIDLAVDISEFEYSSEEGKSAALLRMRTDVYNLVNAISTSILNSLSVFETVDFSDFLESFLKSSESILEVAILNREGKVEVSTNLDRRGKRLGVEFTISQRGFTAEKGKDIYRIIGHVNPNDPEGSHLMLLIDATLYVANLQKLFFTAVATTLLTILFSLTITYSIYRINLERTKKENIRLEEMVKERTTELSEANENLRALNELKNQFIGMASHDLRNPLGHIRGFSELLYEDGGNFSPEEQKQFLETIYSSSDHMLALVNHLLDISVIESGQLKLNIEPCSLDELGRERVHIFDVHARKKNMAFHLSFPEIRDIPLDKSQISQVLDNLISNAIKFSPKGSNVYLSMEIEHSMVKVSVRDEGPGLSQEDQGKLFGTFQKLSAKPTGGEKSTGLGLAIVKKIIETHGGSIKAESQLGSGTTFVFFLPINNEAVKEQGGTG